MGAVTKMAYGRHVKGVLLAMMVLGLLLPGLSQAKTTYYLYQLPDGSRVITEHQVDHGAYKLLKASRKLSSLDLESARLYDPKQPPNIDQFEQIIRNIADRYDVDVALVKAVIRTESNFNPDATSHKGATGLMQLMPKTALRYGVRDFYNPHQNIEGGVRYLRDLLVKYNQQLTFVLAAYNAGEEAVEKYAGIPPYRETQDYVSKVLRYRGYYRAWN